MIYLVTSQTELFQDDLYTIITKEEALKMMLSWDVIQIDSETNGRDAHICDFLCFQFGNRAADAQIVVDCSTVDIKYFKDLIEDNLVIGQNLKFDLQFLYNYGIVPHQVYDTMIVEQLLYLGYPPAGKPGGISYALNAIAQRRLGIDIDKTVRGEIIWRGLDLSTIRYAAGDVQYLEDIRDSQLIDLANQDLFKAAELENRFVPVIAYLEWCGIMLDTKRWKAKMESDNAHLKEAIDNLNKFIVKTPELKKFWYVDSQGDLFTGFSTTPIVTVNWASSKQVIEIAKILGFDTAAKDKKTGEDKDSVLEKHLAMQQGINDEFLQYYFRYKEHEKVVSSFGQGHLNAVNPRTGRIHSTFKQLGAASGKRNYHICLNYVYICSFV